VVDAQPVHEADVEPAPDLAVRGLEHLGFLHPHPGQGGDREEAAVVELAVTPAPGDELVVLLRE
jgi:hypothetical protein